MIARQPFIASQIVDALRRDPTLSWDQVACEIDDWCSPATIQRWVKSHIGKGGYCTYTERLLPLLTREQKAKHVAFCQRLRNNWGQPPGKFLWVHYDEKWFYGFVARHAKACEAIGVDRQGEITMLHPKALLTYTLIVFSPPKFHQFLLLISSLCVFVCVCVCVVSPAKSGSATTRTTSTR